MDTHPLQSAITEDGIRTVNFFNGRLLTGRDLSREQQARREADMRLGLGLGDGVADGLMVSHLGNVAKGDRPAASISAGMAVNRRGEILHLSQSVNLALATVAAPSPALRPCLFDACAPLASGDYIGAGGIWLLTIAPAFADEGRAAVSGMGDASARCAIDAVAEGVQFRLLEIREHLHGLSLTDPRLRNRIAYACFGDGVETAWAATLPGSLPRRDDLLEALRKDGLTDAEVPLAIIAVGASGDHLFTCNHAVRRPLGLRRDGVAIADLVRPRRALVGEAMLAQFHDHLASGSALAGPARAHFAHLPAAGLLPLISDAAIPAWFEGMTTRGPLWIEPAKVEALLRHSLTAPAIDTGSDHAIFLYRIAPHRPPDGPVSGGQCLLFASGHLPVAGEARFNLGHWDFANFALIP
jgi:hypothetical protein